MLYWTFGDLEWLSGIGTVSQQALQAQLKSSLIRFTLLLCWWTVACVSIRNQRLPLQPSFTLFPSAVLCVSLILFLVDCQGPLSAPFGPEPEQRRPPWRPRQETTLTASWL